MKLKKVFSMLQGTNHFPESNLWFFLGRCQGLRRPGKSGGTQYLNCDRVMLLFCTIIVD